MNRDKFTNDLNEIPGYQFDFSYIEENGKYSISGSSLYLIDEYAYVFYIYPKYVGSASLSVFYESNKF